MNPIAGNPVPIGLCGQSKEEREGKRGGKSPWRVVASLTPTRTTTTKFQPFGGNVKGTVSICGKRHGEYLSVVKGYGVLEDF